MNDRSDISNPDLLQDITDCVQPPYFSIFILPIAIEHPQGTRLALTQWCI